MNIQVVNINFLLKAHYCKVLFKTNATNPVKLIMQHDYLDNHTIMTDLLYIYWKAFWKLDVTAMEAAINKLL